MKAIIIYPFLIASLIACSHSIQSDSQVIERQLDTLTTDESVRKVLYKWHKDSLGCLEIRSIKDGVFLSEYFNLKGSTIERVIEILGQPTKIDKDFDWVDNEEYKEWNCTVFSYFCWSACKQGERPALATGWVNIAIDNLTGRVIEIRTAIS